VILVVPGDKHRDHGRWDMDGHPLDWLGNARTRDENVDLPFEGGLLRLSLRFGRG